MIFVKWKTTLTKGGIEPPSPEARDSWSETLLECILGGMSDDQFTKLFKHFDEFRSEVNSRFDNVDQKFNQLRSAVDAYAQKADMYFQEMAAMDHKISRLEKYIEVLAKKAGVDLAAIKF